MFFRTMFATLALTLVSATAFASNLATLTTNQLAHIPYEHIADEVSQPGESEQAFLLRIGPTLRAYSDKTGFEACGMIATDGKGAYSVVLGSSHAHLACVNRPDFVMAGMTSTGETIHSHGKQGVFDMSRTDKTLASVGADPNETVGMSPDSMDLVRVHGQNLYHFSNSDYASGPGYLATPTGLVYEHSGQPDQVIPNTALASTTP